MFRGADFSDFRFFCICASLFLYGLWGSPTPDDPGFFEVAIGALLILASLSGRFIYRLGHILGVQVASPDKYYCYAGESALWQRWHLWGYGFLVYCFTVPLLMAAFYGSELHYILRDLFAVSFLMMPILHSNLLLRKAYYLRWFSYFVVWVGVCFAFRNWYPVFAGEAYSDSMRLLYLSLAPSLLFSALFFVGLLLVSVLRMSRGTLLRFSMWFVLSAVALFWLLFSMSDSLQRATIGLLVCGAVYMVLCAVVQRPIRTLFFVMPLLIIALSLFLSDISFVFEQLLRKNRLVAFNSRFDEFGAVVQSVAYGYDTVLLGLGWGAQFFSPAVGGLMVNYTHNIFSAGLLKTGLAGVILLCFYIFPVIICLVGLLLKGRFKLVSGDRLLTVAVLLPLLISIVFYANYKSLDFGALMLLAVCLCRRESMQPHKVE